MVSRASDYYPDCPQALVVSLARSGDRRAFEELVRRKQSSVRNLMRRCSRDPALADDLAQQVFLKVWMSLRSLKEVAAFDGWLKRVAVSIWLQHARRSDALRGAGELPPAQAGRADHPGVGMDLDAALAQLPEAQRLCVVLAYYEGMSHSEIATAADMPLGTVKAYISRGSERLREILEAYDGHPAGEAT